MDDLDNTNSNNIDTEKREEDTSVSDISVSTNAITRKNTTSVTTKNKDDDSENLKVFIRVRPAVERELDGDVPFKSIVQIENDKKSMSLVEYLGSEQQRKIDDKPNMYNYHRFTFDTVFDMDSTQSEVYESTAKPAIDSLLEGYNSTLFAYGQTGTGKTFTMEGYTKNTFDEARGVIPRSVEEIFNHIETLSTNTKFMVRASYLQIYNEQINDLLKAEKTNLNIREDKKKGVYVDQLSEWSVQKPIDVYNLLKKGTSNRAVSYTKMNDVSSRSHAVFVVIVEQMQIDGDSTQIKVGKLNLVDLAGSERSKSSGVIGKQMDECKKINLSLSALGNVINALAEKKSHIPYRNSKLTRLLEDSLGGNCKTTMMAMVSPSMDSFNETLSTLMFAKRAKSIKNKAKVNEDCDNKTLIRKYEMELKKLREELVGKTNSTPDNELFNRLEDQKNQAEEEKKSALAALDEAGRKFLQEREERKQLEKRIQMMNSQMISGGQRIEETVQFKTALENQHNILVKEFDKKLKEELSKGRQVDTEEKQQVEKYKQLLLKQRDIMIALTTKLNERDDSIEQLHEEIDAYDKINREQEDIIEDKNAKIEFMRDLLKTNNIIIPEQFENIITHLSSEKSNIKKNTLQEMVYLGESEDGIYGYDMKAQLARSDNKIMELNNIISDQEKEIELLKYFTSSTTVVNKDTKREIGKNYLKTIEEQEENNYLKKREIEELTEKYEELERKYENILEEKSFINNKIRTEIKSLVDKLIKKINTENNPKTSLITRDVSFIYKSIVNLIEDNYNADMIANSGYANNNSRNFTKNPDSEISVQINNNNININNFSKSSARSPSPKRNHEFLKSQSLLKMGESPTIEKKDSKTNSPQQLHKSPTKPTLYTTSINIMERPSLAVTDKKMTLNPNTPGKLIENTPNKKTKTFNQTFGGSTKFPASNQKPEKNIIKNIKADPQKIIKSIKLVREKGDMAVVNTSGNDDKDDKEVEKGDVVEISSREISSKNLAGLVPPGGIRSVSVTRENSEKNLIKKKFDMSSSFFKNLHELATKSNQSDINSTKNDDNDSVISNIRQKSDTSMFQKR